MTTQDFICACLRCYKGACIYMDTLQESFDVALTEDDVRATLAINGEHLYNNAGRPLQIGNDLIARLFDKINNKAQEQYPQYAEQIANEFEYFVEDFGSSINFNHEQVNSWDELCEEIEAWIWYQKAIREDKGYDW